ncbi:MAG: guanylate kinase [Coriobacteriales bacterium]|jgi:guanylate kinase|nr:guanylate kinase [Coriobacteriales bacterium]
MRKGILFIISGPSGSGKGTLVNRILKRISKLSLSISATTRTPRPGEVNGREYFFISDEEFDDLIATDGLLEWALVHNRFRYGTPSGNVYAALNAGNDVLLEIDVQGKEQIKLKIPEAVSIFIDPPSFAELEKRLLQRGSESKQDIQRRLCTARLELEHKDEFDHILVNDDLEVATEALCNLIMSYR